MKALKESVNWRIKNPTPDLVGLNDQDYSIRKYVAERYLGNRITKESPENPTFVCAKGQKGAIVEHELVNEFLAKSVGTFAVRAKAAESIRHTLNQDTVSTQDYIEDRLLEAKNRGLKFKVCLNAVG